MISGEAWSENIGWISADASGCPSNPCQPSIDAEGYFSGWFRALAGTSGSGGWDGWISLSGTSPAYNVAQSDTDVIGYAWGGGINLGWLGFTHAGTTYLPCSPNPNAQCTDATHWDNLCTPPPTIENNACGSGLICADGPVPCVPPGNATGDLWLSPSLVPTGNTTEVHWDVSDTSSCLVSGDNGDEWYGGATGLQISSEIIETTLFTLDCANSLGVATTTIDTAYAVVVPTWVEQ